MGDMDPAKGSNDPRLVFQKFEVSSQLVTWPTRTQVNMYPGSPLVTTMEKSTRNQSLSYELTHVFQGENPTRTLGIFLTISSINYE